MSLLGSLLLIAAAQPVTVEVRQSVRLDPRFGIAEGLAAPDAMADIGVGWTRVLLAWDQIQSSGPDTWRFGRVISEPRLDAEVARGMRVAAVLQYTPSWAGTDPAHGHRAVPRNLYLPFDDPENYFGNFVYETVRRYAGRIDEWIIWNEPDIRPEDPAVGESYTWTGTEEELVQLLRVGYLSVKRANPNARVSFPATSYWADTLRGRRLYYERALDELDRDPTAAANNFYHDAVSINLYYKPEDLYRVHGLFKSIQQRFGIDQPVWLTETNAMPVDDHTVPCWERFAQETPWHTTQDEQAAFAVQSYAMAAAAGYERVAWWRLVDGNACIQTGLWGVVRDDRTWRPAAEALRTVATYFSGFTRAEFVPTASVSHVVLDRPNNQRVMVVWNHESSARDFHVPRSGTRAQAVDVRGQPYPLSADDTGWLIELPGATASFPGDPAGYHYIGGSPILVVEDGALTIASRTHWPASNQR